MAFLSEVNESVQVCELNVKSIGTSGTSEVNVTDSLRQSANTHNFSLLIRMASLFIYIWLINLYLVLYFLQHLLL